jgi:cardiolipin synthase
VPPPGSSAAVPPARTDTDRVLTVPNVITAVRLLFLPVFLWLLFARHDRAWAAILLGALGATDWVDGWIARRYHQQSSLGKVLDPTVDRLLFFVGVGGILVDGSAPRWFCLIVLAREITVAAITVTITALGAKPVDVTWFGKAGTFLLMFAFPFFLGGQSTLSLHALYEKLGWATGIPGLALSFYAAFTYVPQWRANLREGRARRRAREAPAAT